MDRWKLRDFTHTLPEWEDPKGSSVPIRPEDILRAGSKSEEEIARLHESAEALFLIDSLQAKQA